MRRLIIVGALLEQAGCDQDREIGGIGPLAPTAPPDAFSVDGYVFDTAFRPVAQARIEPSTVPTPEP
jgi:hypothetical protein